MEGIASITAIGSSTGAPQLTQLGLDHAIGRSSGVGSFQSILSAGIDAVDHKVATADGLVRQFAVDDSIPVHQVTIALEEARLSVELAMQVRTRLVETYRELMNMQL